MNDADLANAVMLAIRAQMPAILSQIKSHGQTQKTPTPAPAPTPTPTPEMIVKNEYQTPPVSRTSSGVSTDQSPFMVSTDQLTRDKNVVRVPMLRKIDATYLANPDSILFKRFYKKRKNPDGSRSLKKKHELDERLFVHLIRPVLRHLLGHAGGDTDNLYKRYINAANIVARKRRNNHMSSWRVRGTCSPLIYGGTLPPGVQETMDQRKKVSVSRKLDLFESPVQAAQTKKKREAPADIVRANKRKAVHVTKAKNQNAEASAATETEATETAASALLQIADFDDEDSFRTEVCAECKVNFNVDKDDWRTEGLRCPACVKKVQETQVANLHHGEIRKSKESKKKKGVSKKKGDRRCKCGSTTHMTIRSKKCPLNKKKHRITKGKRKQYDQ